MIGKTNPGLYLNAHSLIENRKNGLLTFDEEQVIAESYYKNASTERKGKILWYNILLANM